MTSQSAKHDTIQGVDAESNRLRRAKRAARDAIDSADQLHGATALAERLLALPSVSGAATVAVYRAVQGEISLDPVVAALRDAGVTTAYPRVPDGAGRAPLTFHPVQSDDQLVRGVLGIPAPDRNAPVVQSIDVVLVPLVAFDDQCNRLGMGGGYYDTTFAIDPVSSGPRPVLIGVAHDCQRVPRLATRPWDVRLDAVATPTMLLVGNPARI